MKPKPTHKKPKHRNNGGGGGSGGGGSSPRPRRRGLPRRGNPPDFWSTVAAVAGGAGSAVLSGLVVNQSILSPEASAIGLIGIGGTTAYFADGHARIVGNGMASAGAGQLALAMMGRRALKGAPPAPAPVAAAPVAAGGVSADEVVATLEKLHGLVEKGILSQLEFDAKKAELLKKLS